MKIALMLSLVLVLSAGTLLAGGDKVRGDNGQGDVNQVQIQDPPPFQEPDSIWVWLFGLSEESD